MLHGSAQLQHQMLTTLSFWHPILPFCKPGTTAKRCSKISLCNIKGWLHLSSMESQVSTRQMQQSTGRSMRHATPLQIVAHSRFWDKGAVSHCICCIPHAVWVCSVGALFWHVVEICWHDWQYWEAGGSTACCDTLDAGSTEEHA